VHGNTLWETNMHRQRNPKTGRWTAEHVQTWVRAFGSSGPIVVLANREPVRHDRAPDGSVVVRRSASGLVTALEPLIQACSGVWVAHGAGTADRTLVDRHDGVQVPPAGYRLRRVWLDSGEEQGYYYGFSNEGLWPLCHRAHVQPVFRSEDFAMYRAVNTRFAEAVCEEVQSGSPLVLVQDYHFALAPQVIREHLPLSTIVAFWHIPWPGPHDFEICPWARELLQGLLGSSIVGFQTADDCRNFVDSVECSLDAHIDRKRNIITHGGRQTMVRAYPVSVEWPSRCARQSPPIEACCEAVRRQLHVQPDVRLCVGVDRLDYTKGINEKFLAVERLLELYPAYRKCFVLVQIAEPSRNCLPAYRELRSRLLETAGRINRRFGSDTYNPIVLLEAHHEPADVYRFLRAADVCYVGSLHDGMNLVAKEFVSARDDERGVLLLSRFAGAARQLTGALIVNPYATDESAHALADALRMTPEEQSRRMRTMRAVVADFNTYRWAGEMLADAAGLRSDPALLHETRRTHWQPDVLPA
jgi:trehalose 6-phosphate synthase